MWGQTGRRRPCSRCAQDLPLHVGTDPSEACVTAGAFIHPPTYLALSERLEAEVLVSRLDEGVGECFQGIVPMFVRRL